MTSTPRTEAGRYFLSLVEATLPQPLDESGHKRRVELVLAIEAEAIKDAIERVRGLRGGHECWDGDNFIERHPELLDREDVLAALGATPEARSPRHETLRDGLREALQMRWGHELPPDDQPNWDYEARILIVRLTDHGYLPAAYAEGGEGE
jgi:hypothetical protein